MPSISLSFHEKDLNSLFVDRDKRYKKEIKRDVLIFHHLFIVISHCFYFALLEFMYKDFARSSYILDILAEFSSRRYSHYMISFAITFPIQPEY